MRVNLYKRVSNLSSPVWHRTHQNIAAASNSYSGAVAARISRVGQSYNILSEKVDPPGKHKQHVSNATVVLGVVTSSAFKQGRGASSDFRTLPQALQNKIALAGLRGARRSVIDAEIFYKESIPGIIRDFGKKIVGRWLENKDTSHINPVKLAPVSAHDPRNIVWEKFSINRARGTADMRELELFKANATGSIDATGMVTGHSIKMAATEACVGMALECVVGVGENIIYVYHDQRTLGKRAKDMPGSTAKNGVVAVGGVVLSVALTLGAGPVLSSRTPVLITVGTVTYVAVATKRIPAAVEETKNGSTGLH